MVQSTPFCKKHGTSVRALAIAGILSLSAFNIFWLSRFHLMFGDLLFENVDEETNFGRDGIGGLFELGLFSQHQKINEHTAARRIYIELHRNMSLYQGKFEVSYTCNVDPGVRDDLPDKLKQSPGLLDFATTISTDLRILIMGDSVAIQLANVLEEALGISKASKKVLRISWGDFEGLAASGPTHGGGLVASWRITGMLRRDRENKTLPNSPGGGWVRSDATELQQFRWEPSSVAPISPTLTQNKTNAGKLAAKTVGSFDSFIFRIPHGWIDLDQITNDSLVETVSLASELFHTETVTFVNTPFSNNIKSAEDMLGRTRANKLVQDFAAAYNQQIHLRFLQEGTHRGTLGVQRIQILDFGRFTDEVIERHAGIAGFNTSDPNFLLERLTGIKRKYPPSIAQSCSKKVSTLEKKCVLNSISRDGMHWCMRTLGGRISAGLSCLLGCYHNRVTSSTSTAVSVNYSKAPVDHVETQYCEDRCNDQFMSLLPVPDQYFSTVPS